MPADRDRTGAAALAYEWRRCPASGDGVSSTVTPGVAFPAGSGTDDEVLEQVRHPQVQPAAQRAGRVPKELDAIVSQLRTDKNLTVAPVPAASERLGALTEPADVHAEAVAAETEQQQQLPPSNEAADIPSARATAAGGSDSSP